MGYLLIHLLHIILKFNENYVKISRGLRDYFQEKKNPKIGLKF